MRLAFDLTSTVRDMLKTFFNNSESFTTVEDKFSMVNEIVARKVATEAERIEVEDMMQDLTYAIVYYSIGKVFKSVDQEAFRQPMYGFINKHFVPRNRALDKIPARVITRLHEYDIDSPISKYITAQSGGNLDAGEGLFLETICKLAGTISDKLEKFNGYEYRTVDFNCTPDLRILFLTLGPDIRDVLFKQLCPNGYYEGVDLGVDGKPKYSEDTCTFESYTLKDKTGD